MKNTIKVILSLIMILLLTSCESDSSYDIAELLTALNEKYEYNLQPEDFTIIKDRYYMYSAMIDKKTLIVFYCNNNCEIEQCTITSANDSDLLNRLYKQIASLLIGDTDNFNINQSEYNGWKIIRNECKAGITIIINRATNVIHNNKYPKLK